MKNLMNIIKNEDGQGMVEYGLLLGLIAIVAIAALLILGPKVANMFNKAASNLPS